ncbi:MAG: single-stranded DNA-binding protein, partial [Sphingomonadaceae bacterium]|nr:single-stranded DNA-binding protein [Sphingomonadaceae bacterium]
FGGGDYDDFGGGQGGGGQGGGGFGGGRSSGGRGSAGGPNFDNDLDDEVPF